MLILLYQNALFTDISAAVILLQLPIATVATVVTVAIVLSYSTFSALFYIVVFILQILQSILLLLHNHRY